MLFFWHIKYVLLWDFYFWEWGILPLRNTVGVALRCTGANFSASMWSTWSQQWEIQRMGTSVLFLHAGPLCANMLEKKPSGVKRNKLKSSLRWSVTVLLWIQWLSCPLNIFSVCWKALCPEALSALLLQLCRRGFQPCCLLLGIEFWCWLLRAVESPH